MVTARSPDGIDAQDVMLGFAASFRGNCSAPRRATFLPFSGREMSTNLPRCAQPRPANQCWAAAAQL